MTTTQPVKHKATIIDLLSEVVPAYTSLGSATFQGRRLIVGVTLGTMMPIVIDVDNTRAWLGCWCCLLSAALQDLDSIAPSSLTEEPPTCH